MGGCRTFLTQLVNLTDPASDLALSASRSPSMYKPHTAWSYNGEWPVGVKVSLSFSRLLRSGIHSAAVTREVGVAPLGFQESK